MKKISLSICLCLAVLLTALFAQMPEFMKRLSGGEVQNKDFKEELLFTYIDERICVKSKINDSDQEYSFILDTYAPCLIREGLIESIPLDTLDMTEQMGKQLEGSMMKPLFPKYQTIRLGNVIFKDIGAMVMREDEANPFVQVLEDGLIGANLLKCCIWQFDFQEMKMVMTDQIEKLDHLADAIKLPFKPTSLQQSPNIQVTLNDEETLDVQFDTGSKGFLTLSSASLLSLVDSGDAVVLSRRSISPVKKTDAEIETYHYAKLKTLKIGEKSFYDLPVGVYQIEDKKETTRGSIGIEFMKNFFVTIDWPNNQLYLKQIAGRDLKHNIRTFGMTYDYFNGAMRVASIYGGSEAEKSGIKIGDSIIKINGQKVDNLTGEQIKKFLHGKLRFSRNTDDSLSIVFLRDGIHKSVSLSSYMLFK